MRTQALVIGAASLTLAACGSRGCDKDATFSRPPVHVDGLNPACEVILPVAGFHVTTEGTPEGDGSEANPWDLDTAMDHPAGVLPGDTIWVHEGTYTGSFVGKLEGTDGSPVTIRSYPGEWAVIDSRGSGEVVLQIYKQWAVYRDLEITNTGNRPYGLKRPSGIYMEAKHVKLINLVIHDVGTGVIGNSASSQWDELSLELEIYGCIFYNNGWDADDRAHGHHFYTQNRDGTKHIIDNLVFNSYGFGLHLYTDNDEYYNEGYEIVGNVWFNAGVASRGDSKRYDSCLVGGHNPVARTEVRENFGWAPGPGERLNRFGWDYPDNQDITLTDNYFVGETVFEDSWSSVVMTGNMFYGGISGVDTAQYPDNTYVADRPTGVDVFVRENAYQPGRAHIIIYNWDLADTVDVDLGSAMNSGTAFQVRNAQDYFAEPVVDGVFDGSPVSIPLADLEPAQPFGSSGAIQEHETTGLEFNVFVLIANPCGR